MDKIYTNEVIANNPFPGEEPNIQTVIEAPTKDASGNYSASGKITDRTLPQKIISAETESEAFNTRTKKILQEFQFTPQGATQIGQFVPGVSGDIRISPVGILGRNNLGDTTFFVDGETGDSQFHGQVRAKDFIIADERGLLSLANFNHASTVTDILNQHISSSTPADVTGSTNTLLIQRTTNVFIEAKYTLYMFNNGVNGASTTEIDIVIDGIVVASSITDGGLDGVQDHLIGNAWTMMQGCHFLAQLAPGTHTIKLQAKRTTFSGSDVDTVVRGFRLTFIVLGN